MNRMFSSNNKREQRWMRKHFKDTQTPLLSFLPYLWIIVTTFSSSSHTLNSSWSTWSFIPPHAYLLSPLSLYPFVSVEQEEYTAWFGGNRFVRGFDFRFFDFLLSSSCCLFVSRLSPVFSHIIFLPWLVLSLLLVMANLSLSLSLCSCLPYSFLDFPLFLPLGLWTLQSLTLSSSNNILLLSSSFFSVSTRISKRGNRPPRKSLVGRRGEKRKGVGEKETCLRKGFLMFIFLIFLWYCKEGESPPKKKMKDEHS